MNVAQRITVISSFNMKPSVYVANVFNVELGIDDLSIEELEHVILRNESLLLLVYRVESFNKVQVFLAWRQALNRAVSLINYINSWLLLSVYDLFKVCFHDFLLDNLNEPVQFKLLLKYLSHRKFRCYLRLFFLLPAFNTVVSLMARRPANSRLNIIGLLLFLLG